MRKRQSKKGLELSLNTIVIAVIVIVVLVAVVTFFLFGFKGLSDRVKIIFFGTTAGSDMVFAQQQCATYCDRAALLPIGVRSTSPYCTQFIYIDTDNDGEAQFVKGEEGKKQYVKYYCRDGDGDEQNIYLAVTCSVNGVDEIALSSGGCGPENS